MLTSMEELHRPLITLYIKCAKFRLHGEITMTIISKSHWMFHSLICYTGNKRIVFKGPIYSIEAKNDQWIINQYYVIFNMKLWTHGPDVLVPLYWKVLNPWVIQNLWYLVAACLVWQSQNSHLSLCTKSCCCEAWPAFTTEALSEL